MLSDSSNWVNKAASILQFRKERFCNSPVQFVARQYDADDNEIGILDEEELFQLPDFRNYYYRIEPFIDTPRGKASTAHFGVVVSNEGSNAFDYGIYINHLFNDSLSFLKSPKEMLWMMNGNLRFHIRALSIISELDHQEFEKELSYLINHFPISEIQDIRTLNNLPGLYIMVLDDYASCYIGQTKNIKQRIQQHWRKTNFCTTGIDMFKALDTTRVYVVCVSENIRQSKIDRFEYHLVHSIDRKYLLNCHGGGGSLEFIHSDSSNLGYGSDPI